MNKPKRNKTKSKKTDTRDFGATAKKALKKRMRAKRERR
jgi:hypothetical protein